MHINTNNKTIQIKVCKNFFTRLIGFMFHIEPIEYGLCFPKCNCIHTFFMYQPVDVVMTDKNNRILYFYQNLKPWKIIWPKKGVYYTYEFAADSMDYYGVNDIFRVKHNPE